jgi:hypothetical protein
MSAAMINVGLMTESQCAMRTQRLMPTLALRLWQLTLLKSIRRRRAV